MAVLLKRRAWPVSLLPHVVLWCGTPDTRDRGDQALVPGLQSWLCHGPPQSFADVFMSCVTPTKGHAPVPRTSVPCVWCAHLCRVLCVYLCCVCCMHVFAACVLCAQLSCMCVYIRAVCCAHTHAVYVVCTSVLCVCCMHAFAVCVLCAQLCCVCVYIRAVCCMHVFAACVLCAQLCCVCVVCISVLCVVCTPVLCVLCACILMHTRGYGIPGPFLLLPGRFTPSVYLRSVFGVCTCPRGSVVPFLLWGWTLRQGCEDSRRLSRVFPLQYSSVCCLENTIQVP